MKKTCFVLIAFCFAVAGCGGSSGGGGPAALGPGSSVSRVPQLPDLPRPPIVASPPPANTSSVASLEGYYQNHYAFSLAGGEFDAVNLDRAYANLYQARGANEATRPGNGVTIGFVDSGLDTDHPAFDGKRMTVEYFGTASPGSDLANGSHGTSVASIAAGVRKGWLVAGLAATSEGVAPGADIRMFAVDLGNENSSADVEEAIAAAVNPARNVDILNLSLGASANAGIITDSRYANVSSSDAQYQIQAGRAEKTLFVIAAGNENGAGCTSMPGIESCQGGAINASSPGPGPGLMYRVRELRPHSVAVVSVNAASGDGAISSFSNRCGVAADWCIAAPGEGIGVATSQRMSNGSIERSIAVSLEGIFRAEGSDGTSFAAPIVSGGLAIMKQQFRGQLSNVQLLARMLSTATKTGIYADRSIYGQGLLNLGAATNPVGEMTVSAAGPEFVNDDGWQFAPLRDTRLQVGEAFGDGVSKSLAGNEIAAFDSLGAPFWFPLESVAVKTDRSILEGQLQSFMDFPAERTAKANGVSLPLFSDSKREAGERSSGYGSGQFEISVSMARGQTGGQSRLKDGHISFVENPFSFSVGSQKFAFSAFTSDERELKPARGAVVSYRLPNLPLSFRSGFIAESDSALGTTAEGAFGGLRARTMFAGIDYDYSFGDWQVVANAEMGVAYPENKSGLITSASQLATSSFAVGLIRELSGGARLKFSVSSPLRVESGQMDLAVPVGRTPEGGIVRNTVTANFEPSGRQIDFGAQIVAPFSFGDISVGTVATRHSGHNENAGPQVSFLAGYALNI